MYLARMKMNLCILNTYDACSLIQKFIHIEKKIKLKWNIFVKYRLRYCDFGFIPLKQ